MDWMKTHMNNLYKLEGRERKHEEGEKIKEEMLTNKDRERFQVGLLRFALKA